MFLKVIEVGDLHADLWQQLSIIERHIDGPDDVTFGVHLDYGFSMVRHYGYGDRIEWWTAEQIPNTRN